MDTGCAQQTHCLPVGHSECSAPTVSQVHHVASTMEWKGRCISYASFSITAQPPPPPCVVKLSMHGLLEPQPLLTAMGWGTHVIVLCWPPFVACMAHCEMHATFYDMHDLFMICMSPFVICMPPFLRCMPHLSLNAPLCELHGPLCIVHAPLHGVHAPLRCDAYSLAGGEAEKQMVMIQAFQSHFSFDYWDDTYLKPLFRDRQTALTYKHLVQEMQNFADRLQTAADHDHIEDEEDAELPTSGQAITPTSEIGIMQP